ncbi:hypothetical protein EYF80_029172 [Liparis tanakae]|uniref:Uncharacterized protein n=1 Tax=Liparis tanakae TaxID=230148 RepID=A0A4Z2H4L7_9TELE|nr:hypothetical protein EYF80_029172 [Liparis tanakae]
MKLQSGDYGEAALADVERGGRGRLSESVVEPVERRLVLTTQQLDGRKEREREDGDERDEI